MMPHMDALEIGLLVVAAYVSVIALVRLMRRRRDQLIAELRDELERVGAGRQTGVMGGEVKQADRTRKTPPRASRD